MSRKRPSLQDVQRLYPQDLARCTGYVWHLGTRIGKGSFGEVYLGWTNNGKEEVAVKAVSKSYFKQDPKVRENLEREIRIMKLLRNCEYVVHLNHVQDMKQHIVLVMELCEYDLDYLVKASPFREDDITLFLFQLAQGMKALREQNIVHRDLKPGNILIKKDVVTGKMKIKLADFGFARHFTEEGTKKPVDMSSLAGTPVFMAPEALRCVFYPGEHYDDKVDIWSIGALLYKVIVGTCGFYAQLQDIPKILKHKKDAIAFERVSHSRSINYIYELPASVYDRLSPDYRVKMNNLLVHLLKLDPQERMTFPEFFEFVEDLVTSKIEVVNLLQGTSGKIIYDTSMTLDRLKTEVHAQLGVAVAHQLLFSPHTPCSVSPHVQLSPDKFAILMEKCGAKKGNGMLYLLPISDVQKNEGSPDDSCMAQLKFAVTDQMRCVELIKEHKFTNEVVHAINLLQTQQKRQLSGIEEFSKFCSQELEMFKAQSGYQETYGKGLKAAASASLAADWLAADLDGLPKATPTEQAQSVLKTLRQLKLNVNKLVFELDTHYRSSEQQLKKAQQDGKPDIDTAQPAELVKDAKKLPELRQVEMFGRCQTILKRCEELLRQAWGKVRRELFSLWSSLSGVWVMVDKSKQLQQLCLQLDEVLTKTVPQIRSGLLSSLSASAVTHSTGLNSPSPVQTPPLVVIDPVTPAWTRPPPGQWSPAYQQPPPSPAYQQQTAAGSGGAESREMASLREEKDRYESLFNEKAQECADLAVQNRALQAQLKQRHRGSSTSEEERTLSPGQTLRPSTPTEEKTLRTSMSPEDVRVLESLKEQLQQFCTVAGELKPGIAGSVRPRSQTSPSTRKAQSPTLYPELQDEYSIISMPGTERQNSEGAKDKMAAPDNIHLLIPHATQLMSALKDGLKDMDQAIAENSVTGEKTFIKIAKPKDYQRGDIALFHPVVLTKSKVQVPVLMHAEKPYPYILMDRSSFSSFGIRPGRIPDLLVGKLVEPPRLFRFESEPTMADELGGAKGEFYRVKVESTPFKFVPKGAYRPPPPKQKGLGFMRMGHNRDV